METEEYEYTDINIKNCFQCMHPDNLGVCKCPATLRKQKFDYLSNDFCRMEKDNILDNLLKRRNGSYSILQIVNLTDYLYYKYNIFSIEKIPESGTHHVVDLKNQLNIDHNTDNIGFIMFSGKKIIAYYCRKDKNNTTLYYDKYIKDNEKKVFEYRITH